METAPSKAFRIPIQLSVSLSFFRFLLVDFAFVARFAVTLAHCPVLSALLYLSVSSTFAFFV